jgi:ArsR family transcriptional regulator
MKEDDAIKSLAALAHPIRLKVFRALVVSGPRGLVPSVMQEGLGVPASTLSFHLKELANADLVAPERDSRSIVYRAKFDRMNGLLGYLTENCCEGTACVVEAKAGACDC